MSSQGLFSIGGIASGLDTHTIIDQLLQLERQPLARIEEQRERLATTHDAWGTVNTRLSAVRASVNRLMRPEHLEQMALATSTHPDAVAVTPSGKVASDELTFSVAQLARPTQFASGELFSSPDDTLDGRTLTLTIDGEPHDVTTDLSAASTLDELVAHVDSLELGVRAQLLEVAPGTHQLVLTATQTGTANAFTVASSGWDAPFTETQDARDAILQVGGVQVTRSTNQIDDLVDGASITLRDVTSSLVTVRTEQDVDGAVASVQRLVDDLNGLLGTIADLTDYDPDTRVAGPLQGQQGATELAIALRRALTAPVTGADGIERIAAQVGISLTRDGRIQFDEAVLRDALADDPAAVSALLSRAATTTDEAATFTSAASSVPSGTWEVEITQAATAATVTAATTWEAPTEDTTIRITRANGTEVLVTLTSDDTTAGDAAARIQQAIDDLGITTLVAEADGEHLVVRDTRFGSSYGLAVDQLDDLGDVDPQGTAFGLQTALVTGTDVSGTIGGHAATGNGRALTAVEGPAAGLALHVSGHPDAFEVTYSRGLMGEVGAEVARAEGATGTISRSRRSLDSRMRVFDDRIEAFERRLVTREATIRQQFLALENALGELNNQGEWLTQQLAGLNAQLGRR